MTQIVKILLVLCLFPVFVQAQQIVEKKTLHRTYTLNEKSQDFYEEKIVLKEPIKDFSFECLFVDHVNTPVGFELNFGEKQVLKCFNDRIKSGTEIVKVEKGIQKYYHHFVVNFENNYITIFDNGKQVISTVLESTSDFFEVKLLAPFEKHIQLNDLVKEYTIYSSPLSKNEISRQLNTYSEALKNGILPSNETQLIVEPFLSLPTKKSVNLCWESNQPSTGTVKYGTAYPLKNAIELNEPKTLQNLQIENLEEGTNYYAEVEVAISGKVISTTKLSFKTAQNENEAFRLGIIADTEARPFVNAQISRQLWENRPDFFVILGDITDGGWKNYKDQWTLELFAGTNDLMQRVPVIPVAGNGDADLHWFNKYFNPPGKDGFYKYSWGNTDIFVLNSYEKDELAPDKRQYVWLENQLMKSTATWKIVAMHYAPFSSDEDDYGNTWEGPGDQGDPKVRKLVPLFDKYNVDFVTYGHLHCYERTYPLKNNKIDLEKGTTYIIAGGAGGNMEDFAPHRTWFSAKTFRGYHYLIANIYKNSIRIDTYNSDGNMIDFYEKRKD